MTRKDVRLLAYSMSVDRVRAVELRQGTTIEHDFGSSMKLLDQYDAVQGELSSPSMLPPDTHRNQQSNANGNRTQTPSRLTSKTQLCDRACA